MFVFKTLRTFFYFVAFLVIIQLKGINATQLISTNSLYFDPFSDFDGTKVDRTIHFWIGFKGKEELLVRWIRNRINKLGDPETVLQDPVLIDWAKARMELRQKEPEEIAKGDEFTPRQVRFVEKGAKYILNFGPLPETINEKIERISGKYFFLGEISSWFCNKLTAKPFIRDIVGAKYVAHLYGAFKNLDEVLAPEFWDKLPQKFVVKGVLGSYGRFVKIVDKQDPETIKALQSLNDAKKSRVTEERLIVEEFLPSPMEGYSIPDYKFFCSFGKIIWVAVGSGPVHSGSISVEDKFKSLYTTPNWHLLNVTYCGRKRAVIKKPSKLPEMIEVAQKLSSRFPFIRVDLYLTKDEAGQDVVKVGELTTLPAWACGVIDPVGIDYLAGSLMPTFSKVDFDQLRYRDFVDIATWTKKCKESPDPLCGVVVPGFQVKAHIKWDSLLGATVQMLQVLQESNAFSLLDPA
ncbi:MAG: hypothetical protein LBJ77_01450 [Holosporales bacterium]|jgi:hypothetical protein|nr:hypothetical protein [Holosporales bacterium]